MEEACFLARGLGAHLWLLHVEPPEPDFVGYDVGPQSVRDGVAEDAHKHHRQLQEWAERARLREVECTSLLLQGPTVKTLVAKAEELEARYIVVGSHGHGLKQLILGSVSDGLLRKAHCPVVVVRTD